MGKKKGKSPRGGGSPHGGGRGRGRGGGRGSRGSPHGGGGRRSSHGHGGGRGWGVDDSDDYDVVFAVGADIITFSRFIDDTPWRTSSPGRSRGGRGGDRGSPGRGRGRSSRDFRRESPDDNRPRGDGRGLGWSGSKASMVDAAFRGFVSGGYLTPPSEILASRAALSGAPTVAVSQATVTVVADDAVAALQVDETVAVAANAEPADAPLFFIDREGDRPHVAATPNGTAVGQRRRRQTSQTEDAVMDAYEAGECVPSAGSAAGPAAMLRDSDEDEDIDEEDEVSGEDVYTDEDDEDESSYEDESDDDTEDEDEYDNDDMFDDPIDEDIEAAEDDYLRNILEQGSDDSEEEDASVVPENRGQLLLKFLQGRRVPGELLDLEDEDEDEEAEEAEGPAAVVGAKDPLAFLMAPATTPASRPTRRRRRQPMSAEAAEVDRLAQALQLSSSNSEDEDEEAEDEGYSEEDSGAEEDEDSDVESEESDEDVIGAAKPRPPRVNGEEAYRRLLADFDRNAQRQRRHANDLRPIQFAIREAMLHPKRPTRSGRRIDARASWAVEDESSGSEDDDDIVLSLSGRGRRARYAFESSGSRRAQRGWDEYDDSITDFLPLNPRRDKRGGRAAAAATAARGSRVGDVGGPSSRVQVAQSLREIAQRMQAFVLDTDTIEMSVGPDRHNTRHRPQVTALAQLFGLVPTALNKGKRKQVILLCKTTASAVPDPDDLDRLLERLDAMSQARPRDRAPHRTKQNRKREKREELERRKSGGGAGKGKTKSVGGGGSSGSASSFRAVGLAIGTTVAENAPALDERNLGMRMLRDMGWSPGTGLAVAATSLVTGGHTGASRSGILEPINATMRARRRGLGA